jgi:hypothetical protein
VTCRRGERKEKSEVYSLIKRSSGHIRSRMKKKKENNRRRGPPILAQILFSPPPPPPPMSSTHFARTLRPGSSLSFAIGLFAVRLKRCTVHYTSVHIYIFIYCFSFSVCVCLSGVRGIDPPVSMFSPSSTPPPPLGCPQRERERKGIHKSFVCVCVYVE